MKILWLCNIIPSLIAREIHAPVLNVGGWINVLADTLGKNPGYSLTILFPVSKKGQALKGQMETVSYYSFFQNTLNPQHYAPEQEEFFETVLNLTEPDVIHIWGSEYPHTLAMINACEKIGLLPHAVISIQGLVSVCARHYYANLPVRVIYGRTFRDFVRCDSIHNARKQFDMRGIYEVKALQKASHIIGRTEWDLACAKTINPDAVYHRGNEILRASFYEGKWDLEHCQRHSIFVTQWEYPLKGFHMLLEAFQDIVKEYPDARLITTGKNLFKQDIKEKLKQTYYHHYIRKLIKKWKLEKNIIFLGRQLNETEMKEQYLRAHVFVLPSAIENSPNSLGEAMLLGTPVVASDAGGIISMMAHNREGFCYPFDEPYMLAHYVKRIFEDDALALRLSAAERQRASQTHHMQKNIDSYYQIYESVSKSNTPQQLKTQPVRLIAGILQASETEIGDITILKKGMTNRSFLFTYKGKQYIMRIPGEGTARLINRRQEYEVYQTVNGLGLCDEVVYMNPENGYKITAYFKNARPCDPGNKDDVQKCMKRLRSFHESGLTTGHTFDIYKQIEFYESLWEGQASCYRDYPETKHNIYELKKYIDSQPKAYALAHIDAVPDNFLFVENERGECQIRLIDWEYAGMQDPHVDIAMFAIYAMYDREKTDMLIDAYFPEGCSFSLRLKIYCYIAACGLLWSNWCEYKRQIGIEFGEYALRQYQYAKEYYRLVQKKLSEKEHE